jgi:hypothetical protein
MLAMLKHNRFYLVVSMLVLLIGGFVLPSPALALSCASRPEDYWKTIDDYLESSQIAFQGTAISHRVVDRNYQETVFKIENVLKGADQLKEAEVKVYSGWSETWAANYMYELDKSYIVTADYDKDGKLVDHQGILCDFSWGSIRVDTRAEQTKAILAKYPPQAFTPSQTVDLGKLVLTATAVAILLGWGAVLILIVRKHRQK